MPEAIERLAQALADRYRIERELGQGGMATVYLAEDLKHHRKVAVKVLRPELAQVLGVDRFQREIEIAANLIHPHILPVHDSGDAAGLLYYVMPFVEGESLRQRLTREGALPIPETARLLREVADALAKAHRAGVVHRDIKPENILLSDGHALVTDFGVARAVNSAGEAGLTGTGIALGTPAYMAPEQAAADPHVDHRADLYALGVMAYEMLTGRPPFVGGSTQQVLAAQLSKKPDPVATQRPSIPAAMADLVDRCLAKLPGDRPQSAEELLPTLQAAATPAATSAILPSQRGRPSRWFGAIFAVGALLVISAAGLLFRLRSAPRSAGPKPPPSVAVLPFENLTADPANAYFADGIQNEVLTNLAKLGGLKVISRTSVQKYASRPENLRVVAKELGVGAVLEGSVQRAGNRVHVIAQLIDAATDDHLWAETYDREVTDLFAVQSEIATRVANALAAKLAPREAVELAKVPTRNPEAYDLYLRAGFHERRALAGIGDVRAAYDSAVALYGRAVSRDSNFALALAKSAYLQDRMWWDQTDPNRSRIESARQAAERALAIVPELPEGLLALGAVRYHGDRDYAGALELLARSQRALPNEPRVAAYLGFIHRRQGLWDQAMREIQKAAELDPRDVEWAAEMGNGLFSLGKYAESRQWINRALANDPRSVAASVIKTWAYLAQGLTDSAAAVLAGFSPPDNNGDVGRCRFHIAMWERRYDAAVGTLDSLPTWTVSGLINERLPTKFFVGEALEAKGEIGASRKAYLEAQHLLVEATAATPDDPVLWSALGRTEAALGRKEPAIEHGKHAVDLLPVTKDAISGTVQLAGLAAIYARLGLADSAIALLQRLKTMPKSWPIVISAPALRLDPVWDPIRKDPRFQALIAELSAAPAA